MKLKKHYSSLLRFIFICILFFIESFALSNKSQSVQLLITTDLHGWYSSTYLYPNRKKYGLFHLEKIIKEKRSENADLILIDAGDLFFGSPMSIFFFEKDAPPSQIPFIRLLKNLDYDIITLGNHEFEFFEESKKYIRYLSNTSWLSANVVGTQEQYLPYKIITKNNIKLAFIGLTTPSSLKWIKRTHQSVRFLDIETTTARLMKKLKKEEKPDLIIAIFHAGLNPFRSHYLSQLDNQPLANPVLQTIKNVPEIDLVISGHDHVLNIKNELSSVPRLYSTPVIAASFHGKHLIDVLLDFDKTGLKDVRAQAIKANNDQKNSNSTLDSILIERFQSHLNQKSRWQLVKKTNKEAIAQCFNHTLGSIFSEALKTKFTYFPRLKKTTLKRFQLIDRKKIYQWFPYHNYAYSLLLNGKDLDWLEHKYPKLNQKKRYVSRFYFYKGAHLYENDANLLYPIVMNNYNALGGGGILARLLKKKVQIIEQDHQSIRTRFFDYLNKEQPDKAHCGMFQFI